MVLAIFFSSAEAQLEINDSVEIAREANLQRIVKIDKLWWKSWIGIYGAATLGQGAIYYATDNHALKQDMVLGAATTMLGAMALVATPLVPYKQSDFSNEELLKELALREKQGRSWKSHALCGVVNLGSGIITWVGFDRSFKDGLVNFALNTAISEAQILTQPRRAIKDYQNFTNSTDGNSKPAMDWALSAYPGGIKFKINF